MCGVKPARRPELAAEVKYLTLDRRQPATAGSLWASARGQAGGWGPPRGADRQTRRRRRAPSSHTRPRVMPQSWPFARRTVGRSVWAVLMPCCLPSLHRLGVVDIH